MQKQKGTIPYSASDIVHFLDRERLTSMQLRWRETGESCFGLLPLDVGKKRGCARLPRPDKGDIFFDYTLWAHTREEEKAAFM